MKKLSIILTILMSVTFFSRCDLLENLIDTQNGNEDVGNQDPGNTDDNGDTNTGNSLGNKLLAGEQLITDQYLESSNGKYTLTLKADGEVQLKEVQSGKILWKPASSGSGAVRLKVSLKGNLVIRDGSNHIVWESETTGATELKLNDDGSLILYAGSTEIWNANNPDPDPEPDPDPDPDPGSPFTFVVYGDSRSNPSTHNTICGKINSENPELVLHSGDIWDGYSSSEWKGHITSKNNLNTLLKNNKFLVSKGNHEDSSEVKNFSPSIIRNGSLTYSFVQGNVFFVICGQEPSASYLESQLKKSEAQNADFRIIIHHEPIYSGGSHGENGIDSVEKICDKYNVTFSLCGHDHHYERSKVIYEGSSVYSGTNVPANTKGTTYIVTGGGGAPLYGVDSKWWTDKKKSTNHYCVFKSYSDRIEMTVKDKSGSVIETFIRKK